jgi:hypothetical protein
MDTGNSPAPSATGDAVTDLAKRNRKTKIPISDKIALLRAELAQAEADAREAHKARATIVGSIVIEAMEENPTFASEVVALLRSKVKSARDKAAIAELLL